MLPTAPVRNVPEVFFGTTVDDPYRDFEDTKAPAVAAWMKAHSDFAHATLKRIAERDALRAKLEHYDSAAESRAALRSRARSSAACPGRRTAAIDAPDNVVATEVMVKSFDGVMVPISIIYRQGVKLDGSNPHPALRLCQLRHHRRALLQPKPAGLDGPGRGVRHRQPTRQQCLRPPPRRYALARTARTGLSQGPLHSVSGS